MIFGPPLPPFHPRHRRGGSGESTAEDDAFAEAGELLLGGMLILLTGVVLFLLLTLTID